MRNVTGGELGNRVYFKGETEHLKKVLTMMRVLRITKNAVMPLRDREKLAMSLRV